VPFHVAVKAEQLPKVILAEIRGIPPACAHAFPALAIGRNAKNGRSAFKEHRRVRFRDVQTISRAASIAGDEIQVTVVAAQNRMTLVVPACLERLSYPPFVNKPRSRSVALEQLNAVATDCVQPVAINKKPLRSAPAQSRGDDFEPVEHAVAIIIFEATHSGPVPH
jgi:hypothetical protein